MAKFEIKKCNSKLFHSFSSTLFYFTSDFPYDISQSNIESRLQNVCITFYTEIMRCNKNQIRIVHVVRNYSDILVKLIWLGYIYRYQCEQMQIIFLDGKTSKKCILTTPFQYYELSMRPHNILHPSLRNKKVFPSLCLYFSP